MLKTVQASSLGLFHHQCPSFEHTNRNLCHVTSRVYNIIGCVLVLSQPWCSDWLMQQQSSKLQNTTYHFNVTDHLPGKCCTAFCHVFRRQTAITVAARGVVRLYIVWHGSTYLFSSCCIAQQAKQLWLWGRQPSPQLSQPRWWRHCHVPHRGHPSLHTPQ